MKFKNLQKLIAICFFISISATGLFPPWIRLLGVSGLETAIGFSSILIPPDFPAVRIDFARLYLLWIIISAFTAAAMLIASKIESKQ
ncbi:hypothetical protein [Pantoea ananatis]